jgi:DNA processing protein
VPGNLGVENSRGTNLLIRHEKAKLLTDPEQIIEELNLQLSFDQIKAVSRLEETLNGVELAVAKNIEEHTAQFDHLLEYVKINAAELMQTLSKLELKGIIGRDKNGAYFLIK